MILVSVSPQEGTLRRYVKESGAGFARLTHRWQAKGAPVLFHRAPVEEFYSNPPECDRVAPVSAYTPAYDFPPCA